MITSGQIGTGVDIMVVTYSGYDYLAYARGTTAATSYHRRGTNVTASTSAAYQGSFTDNTVVTLDIDEVITDNNDVPYFKVLVYQTNHGIVRPDTV